MTDGEVPNPAIAVVTINVPPPKPITAVNDTYYVEFDTPYTCPDSSPITKNDISPNANPQLRVVSVQEALPSQGVFTWAADGSCAFKPAPLFKGALWVQEEQARLGACPVGCWRPLAGVTCVPVACPSFWLCPSWLLKASPPLLAGLLT